MERRNADARAHVATILLSVLSAKPVWDSLFASLTAVIPQSAYVLLSVAWRVHSPAICPLQHIYTLLCERCCDVVPFIGTYDRVYAPLRRWDFSIPWVRDALVRVSYDLATGNVAFKAHDLSRERDHLELAMSVAGVTLASVHAYGHLTLTFKRNFNILETMDCLIPHLLASAAASCVHASLLRLAGHLSARGYQHDGDSEPDRHALGYAELAKHIRVRLSLVPSHDYYCSRFHQAWYSLKGGKGASASSILSIMTWFELDRETVCYFLTHIDPRRDPNAWDDARLVNGLKAVIQAVVRFPIDDRLDHDISRTPMVGWCFRLLDLSAQVQVLRLACRVAIASALLAHLPSEKATTELKKAVRDSLMADPGACRKIPRFMRRFWHVPGR